MIKKILVIFLIGFLNLNSNAFSNDHILNSLKEGKKLVFIRHAIAPGNGDPNNFDLNDCSTQRNLDKNGILQSKKIGLFFKKNKIKIIGRVSMDLIAVSIGDVNCSEGDWVTIWGGQDEDSRLENIASMHKEIPYTYITGITQRVEREYILD